MTDAPDDEVDAPLQADGSHMAEPEFSVVPGRAELNADGEWIYIPGKGETGYNPADWAS